MRKALPILAVAVLFAGCGSSPEPSTVSAVTQAYRSWDDAAIAGDAKASCSRMTERFWKSELIRSASKSKTCEGLVKEFAAYAARHPEVKSYKLSNIDVEGDKATLTDRTPYGDQIDTARMSLVRENGRWKVDTQVLVEQGGTPGTGPAPSGLES